jgi:membrane protein YdbS with pleckstrin-like domain
MTAPSPEKSALPALPGALAYPNQSLQPDQRMEHGRSERESDNQETDVWWGSYAGRTMLPGFVICLVLTIVLLALDAYLGSQQWRSDLISSAILATAGALWLFEGTRWVYRTIAVNYRLTNRRLLYMRGFKLPDSRAVELARISQVTVASGPIERLLGVGRISIQLENESSPSLVLDGVLAPEHVARTIRRRVRQARGMNETDRNHAGSN